MRKRLSLAALAAAASVSTAAQADTIFFQTFTDGLTAQEKVGGTFNVLNNRVGHTDGLYDNFEYSYYQVTLDLTHFSDVLLMFDYDLVSEENYDGFNVLASTDGAFDPTKIVRSLSSDFYGPMLNNLPNLGRVAVSGNKRGTTRFDLSQFAGQKIDLRFQFQSDYGVVGRGLLLDNIIVTGTPDATTAVPEPAAWALMILGFGAAGSALRRRRTALA